MSIPYSLHFLKGGLAQSTSSESPSEQGENYITFSNRIIQVMSVAAGCKEHPTLQRTKNLPGHSVKKFAVSFFSRHHSTGIFQLNSL